MRYYQAIPQRLKPAILSALTAGSKARRVS
jgi:hypothetical protein